ncbi:MULTISPECIES: OmpA family protein [unclassified Leisingera]|uniref:OmpA family protein n=1 Tax=unclassified Leisingera TaxID=2614906 RepID=UPI0002F6C50E|nr:MULTISPECIES: OmpA family protein [unclassified Leisingera]KIC24636.1 membrane protein [Leisingera sp. ANG-S3]KIC31709.1 membrane protein [Leisingera sp. ANG-S5]KIC55508.1 membrane protein [Leisingera sp. ANG-S]KID09240.1 membrane protein [Leisingera sp. ANG1]
MRLSSLLIPGLAFTAAAGLSLVAAGFAVTAVERSTETGVRETLDTAGHTWAEVTADGLQVLLEGTAPDEATRFSVISLVGGVVDAARIIDGMKVPPAKGLAPPRFSAEILRNDSGISIIGLIPAGSGRAAMVKQLNALAGEGSVADLLETAKYAKPEGWQQALDFAVEALKLLPRAKISVEAGEVSITAISGSEEAKHQLEEQLGRLAPPGLRLAMDIAAPRPVITPFTLRFLLDKDGAQFDACSAESEESRNRILEAARKAGLEGEADCVIGMGVPSPNWARASELSIASLAELGGGTVTIANADITLVAAEGTASGAFDHVVGELESALPRVFALHAVLPVPEASATAGPPEFTATLSPEGQVQLRGRLSDAALRTVADSYAKARFGSANVHTATRVVADLPADWPVRVLAGLEALSYLQRGSVTVTPENLELRGMSYRKDALAEISRFLSAKLGEAETYGLDITYEEPPAPADQPIPPELCEAQLAGAQAESKIAFEPGSATIAAESAATMDRIAEVLGNCGPVRLEIQGHTDSQGREVMNQNLSQARAQSVLNELRARRVVTSTFAAKGYGESEPIADNGTEEGREANRRIEFKLVRPAEQTEVNDDDSGAAAESADGAQETPEE